MLIIQYFNQGIKEEIKYSSENQFVARQQLEVPDLQDYYRIAKVTLNGKPVTDFKGTTIIDLFNHYNILG
ncbi:hypothetical protein LM596_09335 [Liquorilactobacillus mali]|nr:hypothetical protein [Liquorilactobacillus mali]EJE97334.1 hypothetical protein LMA_10220 [Liquorilactobacillus mali KCTC 3596 = DSM 20444]MDC7953113.1 hypothetical protein [Liquorilactobacillus mali]QFQ75284.1 hypothetical protein LM596_09335 [Liquorilactobacillus mali]